MMLSLLLLVLPAAVLATEELDNAANNTAIASILALHLTEAAHFNRSYPNPLPTPKSNHSSKKTSKPTNIGSSRTERPKLSSSKKPSTTSTTTTTLSPANTSPELPKCEKERNCDSKRNCEEFRELVVALHKELRRELDVDTWHFSGDRLTELDLEYSCELEKLAHQRIQSCKKALYSSKTNNSDVIRRHLGQEKVMAFLKAFSYWRNQKENRTNEHFKPHTEYDKLLWDTLSAIGCAVKQCKKRGERFTFVDCKYDYETHGNVLG